ncbi:hypothetical protein B9Z55_008217 [Caenorhabditis nigoni]|uniref:Uncharacterized protein n=1 Tax=Caenorhabditis nigoni TaxID=1611254 RepID=A0A2G5VD60_9PELO|nr:hypothetical protein B9Z55_008217 [Caenorhabditis nigoni]
MDQQNRAWKHINKWEEYGNPELIFQQLPGSYFHPVIRFRTAQQRPIKHLLSPKAWAANAPPISLQAPDSKVKNGPTKEPESESTSGRNMEITGTSLSSIESSTIRGVPKDLEKMNWMWMESGEQKQAN